MFWTRLFVLLWLPAVVTACAFAALPLDETVAETAEAPQSPALPAPVLTPTTAPSETIILPISVYILDVDDSDELSSIRTVEQLEDVYHKANEIWNQAGIRLDVQTVDRITVPEEALLALTNQDFRTFFTVLQTEVDIPAPSLLNGFYAAGIGGPNGITPLGSHVFFVTDTPSVHDERVTSHEIGHILGLHHTQTDRGRLMFPGTNGMSLTEEEIVVARYGARGLLSGMR